MSRKNTDAIAVPEAGWGESEFAPVFVSSTGERDGVCVIESDFML
jgi:hypothetical protein